MYPLSLCCIVLVKLIVLHRLMEFCKLEVLAGAGRWSWVGRSVIAVVVIGSAVGWCASRPPSMHFCDILRRCGNVAASVSFLNASEIFSSPKATNLDSADDYIAQGAQAAAIHIAFETIMLLLFVVTVA